MTLDEFQQLVPPFEAAFQAPKAACRLDGRPRTARQFAISKNYPLPPAEDRLFFLLTSLKTYTLQVRHGRLFGRGLSKANPWMHALLPALLAALRTLGDAPARSRTALAQRLGVSEATAATVVPLAAEPAPVVTGPSAASASPLLPMTARRIVRPQEPTEQKESYNGKTKDHTVKNVLLVHALLLILLLSNPYGGRSHAKRIAEATPYPFPVGSRLLQDLGFLACTLSQVAILRPTKKPRDEDLSREQHVANQTLHQRQRRLEQVNRSIKRCRLVNNRLRLWKQGVRALVMARCCALHHCRVRLTPWQPRGNRANLISCCHTPQPLLRLPSRQRPLASEAVRAA